MVTHASVHSVRLVLTNRNLSVDIGFESPSSGYRGLTEPAREKLVSEVGSGELKHVILRESDVLCCRK